MATSCILWIWAETAEGNATVAKSHELTITALPASFFNMLEDMVSLRGHDPDPG